MRLSVSVRVYFSQFEAETPSCSWMCAPLWTLSSRQVLVLTACGRRRSPSASATGSCIWSFCISDSPGRPCFLSAQHEMQSLRGTSTTSSSPVTFSGGEPLRHTECGPTRNATNKSGSYLMITLRQQRWCHCGAGAPRGP